LVSLVLLVAVVAPYVSTQSGDSIPIQEPLAGEEWSLLKCFSVEKIGYLYSLAYSPKGEFLAAGGELGTVILNTSTYEEIAFLGSLIRVVSLSFSPNGSYLMGGSKLIHPSSGEETIKVWSTYDWSTVTSLFPTLDQLGSLSLSPNGLDIAALEMGRVHVWSALNWSHTTDFMNGHGTSSLVFSPNGSYVSAGWGKGINVFETANWTLLGNIESPIPVSPIEFSPNGSYLATVDLYGPTKILQTSNWSIIQDLTSSWVRVLAFSPDGAILATWMDNGTIVMWDTSTWSSTQELPESSWHADIVFSPNGTHFSAGSVSGKISAWSHSKRNPPAPAGLEGAILSGENLEDVVIHWRLSTDDGSGEMDVTNYAIYHSLSYDANGDEYEFLAEVPAGRTSFLHEGVGDGDLRNHFYYVQANDADGLSSWEGQAGKFVRHLNEGLQLASIPLIQSNTALDVVLQTLKGNYEFVRCYAASDQVDPWKSYWTFKTYRDLYRMDEKMGFWIGMTEDDYLVVAGIVRDSVIHLSRGWNLVGYPSLSEKTIDTSLADVDYVKINGFGDTPPYYIVELIGPDAMKPGEGYWISVDSDQIWKI
jgi:hypothetical protein